MAFIPVEPVAVLGHQVQQKGAHVKPEHRVVALSRVPQPSLDVGDWPALGYQHGHGQRGRVARIAKAEIIDIQSAGEAALRRDNDIAPLRRPE